MFLCLSFHALLHPYKQTHVENAQTQNLLESVATNVDYFKSFHNKKSEYNFQYRVALALQVDQRGSSLL